MHNSTDEELRKFLTAHQGKNFVKTHMKDTHRLAPLCDQVWAWLPRPDTAEEGRRERGAWLLWGSLCSGTVPVCSQGDVTDLALTAVGVTVGSAV